MSDPVLDRSVSAASALLGQGYRVTEHVYDPEHFGNGWVALSRGDACLRLVKERGQWFVDVGSSAAPEEWFDARLVLDEIGATHEEAGTDEVALGALCNVLARTAAQWEVLFLRSTFATARKSLRTRQIASAKEQFGLTLGET